MWNLTKQNRNRPMDIENKLMVDKGGRGQGKEEENKPAIIVGNVTTLVMI